MTQPMMDLVLAAPDQLRWGLDVAVPDVAPSRDILILGMGGSAMAGRVAALAVSEGGARVTIHQGYGLPAWATQARPLVLAVSYSGNTEETLSGLAEAGDLGLEVAAVASGGRIGDNAAAHGHPFLTVPGGIQPRAALGYQVGAVLRLLEGAGAVSGVDGILSEAAAVVEESLGGGEGAGYLLGVDLAAALGDRIPIVIGGAGPAGLAAVRWVRQINENAKRVASSEEVPEMNHNALEAWATPGSEPGRLGVVALRDPAGNARNEERITLTLRTLGERVPLAGEVLASGTGVLARTMSLIAVGDVTSVALADAAGVDATPVEVLEGFKRSLPAMGT